MPSSRYRIGGSGGDGKVVLICLARVATVVRVRDHVALIRFVMLAAQLSEWAPQPIVSVGWAVRTYRQHKVRKRRL